MNKSNTLSLWSGLWRFKLHRKWPKGCTISPCCFSSNHTKKWFLTYWGRDNNTHRGPWTHQTLEKRHCSLSKIMNNKQVLVHEYELLESTSHLRSIFMGHIHLKKLMNFENLLKYFTVAWPGYGTRKKVSFNHIYW